MIPTLEPWVAVVRTRLPACLADESMIGRLCRVARRVPFDGQGALEIRLGEAALAPAVDLAFHLRTPAQARAAADRIAPARLRRFLSSWARGEHPEAASLWLELDLEREPEARPVPGICAGLGGAIAPELLADRLLPALRGRPLAAPVRRRLLRCLAAIPAPGRLLYAASMESRRDEAVRLIVAGLGEEGLVGFLDRVAPSSLARRAAEAMALVAGGARTHLSFDVHDEVGERIGIECSFPRLPAREPGWSELLGRWAAAGLVSAEERAALLIWTGYDSAWTAAARWPAAVEASGTFCIRCLSHLKLVSIPAGPLAAKAYLLFGPLRRARGRTVSTASAVRLPALQVN